jgi:hypothetical protein
MSLLCFLALISQQFHNVVKILSPSQQTVDVIQHRNFCNCEINLNRRFVPRLLNFYIKIIVIRRDII